MVLQNSCFSSATVQLSHLHICLILIITCVFHFLLSSLPLNISMCLLQISKNSFMTKDVNHLLCNANEIAYFIAFSSL